MIMKESTTYQGIFEEGQSQGLSHFRSALLRLGSKRFGSPSGAIHAALLQITEAAKLEELTVRIFDVNGWDDLLKSI